MTITGNPDLALLPTEARNLRTLDLDQLSVLQLSEAIHAGDQEAVAAVGGELPAIAEAIESLATRLGAGGRLFYIGAGTSGRLGVLDAAECPPTFNSPPAMVQGLVAGGDYALRHAVEGAEDDPQQAAEDLKTCDFQPEDTLVGIAASGRTPYVLGGIRYAREIGAWTLALSCVADSELARAADLAITPLTGPEVVAGSTRMKAGTATKLVLNMLSTGAMVRLGYVYSNLMVNVQPTNEKLVHRALRIVSALTGLKAEAARALLAEAESVRVAVVMHRLGVSRAEAEIKLLAASNSLRAVVGEIDT